MSSSTPPAFARDLFAAARDDAPPASARDLVWGRVAATIATPSPATSAAPMKAAAASAKLLVVGAFIGAASAAVVALTVASLGDHRSPPPIGARREPAVVVSGVTLGAKRAEEAPRLRHERVPLSAEPAALLAPVTTAFEGGAGSSTSVLGEEARLVTDARAALVRGEPERALALARSTRRLRARALEPEELGLEVRALRALGRADEALATELTLRTRFPSHALSRWRVAALTCVEPEIPRLPPSASR